MKIRISLSILLWGFIRPTAYAGDVSSRFASSPCPPSAIIRSVHWDWDTYKTAAIGSDLWPVTWGPDDNLYAAWGDGGGFGGSDTDGRVSLGFGRIEGDPEHFRGINLNGGKHPLHPSSFPKKGKTDGILFVGNTLYATINLQDGHWPHINHVLAWSEDQGANWTKANWLFPGGKGRFEPAKFVNFGKAYADVPPPLSGFIYFIGPGFDDTPTGRGKSLYLARTPTDKVRQRENLEFFAGTNSAGKPAWQPEFKSARPIFTDPNGVSPGSITYDPALHRYLLSCFHSGPSQLGIFDAPEAWGPWTTIAYSEDWGNMTAKGEGLGCEFPSKWISPDGLSLWCVFTVYGDGAKKGINAHDKFNLVRATLRLE